MTIVYCANKKIYPQLPTAINSLLQNNPNIKKIYLLIEDDSIPYITNPKIEFINCNNFDFLIREGMCCTKRFPYMATVRCFLGSILKEDKIIYLDVDTLVDGSLEELWNLNISNKCIAGRYEAKGYINSGVLLMNLNLIRNLKYEDKIKNLLENCKFQFPDQDALNLIYKIYKTNIPKKFNILGNKEPLEEKTIIRHFAGMTKPWQGEMELNSDKELYNKYKVEKI